MTDAEICTSKREHWNLSHWLQRMVCAGTPSRYGWVFDANGRRLGLWNFTKERQVRKKRVKSP